MALWENTSHCPVASVASADLLRSQEQRAIWTAFGDRLYQPQQSASLLQGVQLGQQLHRQLWVLVDTEITSNTAKPLVLQRKVTASVKDYKAI